MLKKIMYVLLGALVLIQFFHPEKNQSSIPYPNDITTKYPVPATVQDVLKRSCYDCHSNNTAYPWYNNLQPVAWWLKNHVDEGKREINFNEFATYEPKKARRKLHEVAEQVEEGEMPLTSYTLIHKDAILDPAQKKIVADWAKSLRDSITTANGLPTLEAERAEWERTHPRK
jgi:hypothetical protein